MKDRIVGVVGAKRVREVLDYSPATGEFRWKFRTGPRGHIGGLAGCLNGNGYRVISIDGRGYRACRLAWLYMTGEWPEIEIDHVNRVRDDDKWSNLRQHTRGEQLHNTGRRRDNTSGHRDISFFKPRNMWRVRLHKGGKEVCNRYFHELADAVAARDTLRAEFGLPPAIDEQVPLDGYVQDDGKQPDFVRNPTGDMGFFCGCCGMTQFPSEGPMDFVLDIDARSGNEILVCAPCKRAIELTKKDPDLMLHIAAVNAHINRTSAAPEPQPRRNIVSLDRKRPA